MSCVAKRGYMNLLGPSILQGTKTIKNFKSCRAWKNNAMLNTCMFMQQCRNQPRLFFTRQPACQSVHVFFVHLRSGSRSSSSGLWEPPRLHRALFSSQGAMRPPHLLGATLASMAELSCWSLLQPANPHTISNTATHQAKLQAHPQSTKRSGNLAPPQNCMQAGNLLQVRTRTTPWRVQLVSRKPTCRGPRLWTNQSRRQPYPHHFRLNTIFVLHWGNSPFCNNPFNQESSNHNDKLHWLTWDWSS